MDEFYRHENQGTLPSLSDKGNLRHGSRSGLMSYVESLITVPEKDLPDLYAYLITSICKPC